MIKLGLLQLGFLMLYILTRECSCAGKSDVKNLQGSLPKQLEFCFLHCFFFN